MLTVDGKQSTSSHFCEVTMESLCLNSQLIWCYYWSIEFIFIFSQTLCYTYSSASGTQLSQKKCIIFVTICISRCPTAFQVSIEIYLAGLHNPFWNPIIQLTHGEFQSLSEVWSCFYVNFPERCLILICVCNICFTHTNQIAKDVKCLSCFLVNIDWFPFCSLANWQTLGTRLCSGGKQGGRGAMQHPDEI